MSDGLPVCQSCKQPLAVQSVMGTAGLCCECVSDGFPRADAMSDDRRKSLIVGNLPEETVAALADTYMSDKAYNDGYTHEALHTTFVLMETFANYVLDTRCADEFSDVKAAAETAHQALFDLYQLIGSKMGES